MKVAILIPTYNEAATIGTVVQAVQSYGMALVVDDASTDGSGGIATEAGATVVRHAWNRGYDGALQSGFERADASGVDIVVTFDADGQHEASAIEAILAPLRADQADLVLGIRPRAPRFSERLFNCYGRKRFAVPDLLCGLKAYRISLYRRHGRFDGTRSIGTELAIASLTRGARVACVPVRVNPRADHSRIGSFWRANWRLLRALRMAFFTVASVKAEPKRS